MYLDHNVSMENASGSGDFLNATNFKFDCINPADLSLFNVTDNEFWSLRESVRGGGIPIALFEAIIVFVALIWNLFIVITYIVKFKLLKEPANILLLSLAVNDILICLLVVPFSLVAAVNGEFVIGSNDVVRCQTCSTQGFFFIFLTVVQVHLIALLSIDRCIALISVNRFRNPLKYKSVKNVWATVAGVIAVCAVCFILSVPPAFGFGEWEFNRNFGLCMPQWTPILPNGLYMGIVILECFIPIFVIALTNVWTYKIVHRFLSKNVQRKKSFRNTKHEVNEEELLHRKQQHQLVKVFGALLIANIVTWFPIIIMFFVVIITSGENVPEYLYIIGWLCYLLSPTIHPILESCFIKELRTRVNKAKKSVRTKVNKASKSIIRMATLDAFKNVPEYNEGNGHTKITRANTTSHFENLKATSNSPFPLTKGMTAPELYPPSADTTSCLKPNIGSQALSSTLYKISETSLEFQTDSCSVNSINGKRNKHICISLPPGSSELYNTDKPFKQSGVHPDSPQQVLADDTVVHISNVDTDCNIEIGQVVNKPVRE